MRASFVQGRYLKLPAAAWWYEAAVALAALTIACSAAGRFAFDVLLAFVALAVLASLSTRFVTVFGKIDLTGEFLILACASCVIPGIAPLLGLTSAFGPCSSLRNRLLNASSLVIGIWAGTVVSSAVVTDGGTLGATMTAAAVSTSVLLIVNSAIVLVSVALDGEPVARLVPTVLASIAATGVLLVPLVGLMTAAVDKMGPLSLPMLLLPVAVAQYFHGLYQRKVDLTAQLADKARVLAKTNLQFAAAMVRALDSRDAYTAGHSAAVAVYTRDIAREMGCDDETIRVAHLAGLLHDIGKIGVPGRVLNKQGPLDDEEFELMKQHAAAGASILGEVDLYAEIAVIVRHHHERIDGRGYPDAIGGEVIPAVSRMISVADTYSAMTTDRPYRQGMPTVKAMLILAEARGTQLDELYAEAFLRILERSDDAYQRGKQTDFEVEVAKHEALSQVEAETLRVAAGEVREREADAAPPMPTGPIVAIEDLDLEREAA